MIRKRGDTVIGTLSNWDCNFHYTNVFFQTKSNLDVVYLGFLQLVDGEGVSLGFLQLVDGEDREYRCLD
jgi:hypothetical protein